jgi:hypothetical protein
MKIHPVTNYLIVGTHGRSMYRINLNNLVDVDDANPPDMNLLESKLPKPI